VLRLARSVGTDFWAGFGDLFVIRVAGNIVAPSQVGSVEFAAEVFGTRLALVVGHTQCGAVAATLQELRQPQGHESPNLRAIVNRIRPAVEPLLATPSRRIPRRSPPRPRVQTSGFCCAPATRVGAARAANRARRPVDRGSGVLCEDGTVEFFDD